MIEQPSSERKIEECGCPMTIKNCEKYGVTDAQVKRFCGKGCSPICGKEFVASFIAPKMVI